MHTEVWEDLVFVNFDPEPRETLREWLGDMYDQYTGFFAGRQKIADHRIVMWFWPIDHEHTDVRVQRFAFASDRPSDRVAQAYSKVRFREVLREDLATMEAVYAAVSTGALPHIILSQQELLIQNHYRAANDMLATN